jgi:cyclophilin family peptidyl-prolyl cis-trans isomerase
VTVRLRSSLHNVAACLVLTLAACSSAARSTSPGANTSSPSNSTAVAGPLDGSQCPPLDGSAPKIVHFAFAPPTCIDPAKTYTATINTNKGVIVVALDAKAAPLAVNSFVFLAGYHYFDATNCHRVIYGFVIQCGDPSATGTGGPGYEFKDELPAAGSYKIGSLAMANAGPDTNGSQFFVISGQQGVDLPPKYTLFGQVTQGLDTVSTINNLGSDGEGAPEEPISIRTVMITVS